MYVDGMGWVKGGVGVDVGVGISRFKGMFVGRGREWGEYLHDVIRRRQRRPPFDRCQTSTPTSTRHYRPPLGGNGRWGW